MTDTALRITRRGAVLILENQDPPRNRMTFEYMDELERAVIALRDDREARAVVITAAGEEHFSVGMDLKQLMSGAQARGGFEAILDQRLRVLSLIEQLDKPVIATMFGYCLGGGLELPLACHFRLAATEGARIGLPELDLGTVPAWGGTARLTRTVGRAHALDMILRAKKIDGPTALAIGLVHELHPIAELKARALELAEELAAQPPIAVAGVLRAVVGAEHATARGSAAQRTRRRPPVQQLGRPDRRHGRVSREATTTIPGPLTNTPPRSAHGLARP